MLINESAVITAVRPLLGASTSLISEDGYGAVGAAVTRELGVTYPVDNSVKEYWMVERGRRHALMLLTVEAAQKFRYKNAHLQHRFQNYEKLIRMLDESFEKALEENPTLFPDMGLLTSDGEAFMKLIGPGFVYEDETGVELTYLGDLTE